MAAPSVRRRVLVALVAAVAFYTLSDILLWQRIFESHGLYLFDSQYQTGHVVILVGIMSVGAILLLDSGAWVLWFVGGLYTLTFGGVEDVLYYWLDGRAIPATLPWLDASRLIFIRPGGGDVSSGELVASAAFWVIAWLALLCVTPRLAGRCRSWIAAWSTRAGP